MIGQSDFRPQQFAVNELVNGMAEILLYENITEFESVDFEQNTKTMYEFDMYEIMVQNREGLLNDIEANYSEWLNYAKWKTSKSLSDKEKIVEMQSKIDTQDAVMDELMFEVIPSMIGGVA